MGYAECDKKPGEELLDYLSDSFARNYLTCGVGFTTSVRDLQKIYRRTCQESDTESTPHPLVVLHDP
jgi:hypothetical protein